MVKKKIKNNLLLSILILSLTLPITQSLASEKGEAGNAGEVEFYLEKEPKPDPNPNPKPIIKLPQTSNQASNFATFIGVIVLLGSMGGFYKRRDTNE